MASYSDKLKDPRWQKKRLEILNRDNFTCLCCGSSTRTLHIHHRYYLKVEPWEYPNDALDTLCESCHKYVEALKKGERIENKVDQLENDPWFTETDKPDLYDEDGKRRPIKFIDPFDDSHLPF